MEGSFYHNTQPVSKNYYKKLYNSETFHNKRSILIWKSGDQMCSRKIKSGCGYFFNGTAKIRITPINTVVHDDQSTDCDA